ncbi:hypothetical protein REH65_07830 [Saccharopolyspora sp. ID03-671]|uniref:DUF7064 domain-containing protein n=1 Tax=Saccharopolyspora sp. ID03-671 TaxID=3073066 RepID=UPI00324F12E7
MANDFHDDLVAPGTLGLPERFFDRFMFNLHPADATAPSVIMGFGHYPAKDVADGFAIVSTEKEQRNLRFSTELSCTDGKGAGPLSFEVVEPNRAWRLKLDPNPSGMEYDLIWRARTPYWLGEVAVTNADATPTKFEHLVQSGRYEGTLTIDGVRQDVDGWYGQRDRSRGVRTMSGGQGLHIWFQAQFPDRSVGFLLVEDRQGGRLLLEGAILHEDGGLDDVVDVRHALNFDALDLTSGTIEVSTKSGMRYEIDADASGGGGLMAGAGYGGHHGRPRGRDHVEHEVYPLDGSVNQLTVDSSLTDRLTAYTWNGVPGTGIFEFALTRSSSYTYRPTLT